MRRDAQVRRDALIAAAEACFLRSGYLVPLEEVAERAGVGRGTLYRNFKDRLDLAFAIFEREVDRLEAGFDGSLALDDAIVELVIGGAGASTLFSRLAADMPLAGSNRAPFEQLGQRLQGLLEPCVERAHREGRLSPGIGAREVFIAVRMLSGLIHPHQSAAEMRALVGEALPLVLAGLRPR